MQTTRDSHREAGANAVIGFIIAVILQNLLVPGYSVFENFGVVIAFTIVNYIRAFIIRRWYANREQ